MVRIETTKTDATSANNSTGGIGTSTVANSGSDMGNNFSTTQRCVRRQGPATTRIWDRHGGHARDNVSSLVSSSLKTGLAICRFGRLRSSNREQRPCSIYVRLWPIVDQGHVRSPKRTSIRIKLPLTRREYTRLPEKHYSRAWSLPVCSSLSPSD